jgi:hypothetical protein
MSLLTISIVFNVGCCRTYIFTFDSLGGRHPQAIKKLSAYLKMEARDKKGIDNAAVAGGKPALVCVTVFPSQSCVEEFHRCPANRTTVTVGSTFFISLRLL